MDEPRTGTKKRLVVCCDGTWNRADADTVTNIEKIARTIESDPTRTGGVPQQVLYLTGVGTAGYKTDRLLGGAFGFGLFANVKTAYRWLALNYEAGDEIFVFGFSRGAYTARSLAGMIGRVGLLTGEALVDGRLGEACQRYQLREHPKPEWSPPEQFRKEFCHDEVPIQFLGVFDTVGALGVPGAVRRGHQFHDVRLGSAVVTARQALAIDEPRMKFEPCLWEEPVPPWEDGRIRQVWFEGAHSDVGGGYGAKECGLSDTALLWMAAEAQDKGLVLDLDLFERQLKGSPLVRHNPSKPVYRFLDLAIRAKIAVKVADGGAFEGERRRLFRPECAGIRLARTTATRYDDAGLGYHPRNLHSYDTSTRHFDGVLEDTVVVPSEAYDALLARLRAGGQQVAGGGDSVPGPRVATESASEMTQPT
ncbi:DUF2235 domain-containing protein [Nocardioides marmoribigeumensis]|uniref:T6SS Phospholipase effector Tle1-like catalytic domain-containing protein n=1 Tax=Nocardioides marmoribigeumensis TaxID=433649 RepID=A0ABU2BX03_9ACTN|nr:DUF2235 domain-containing protein [Nocardioides marmoribigeumensis]MDR7362704.1 hypothetical protein [Nocardioides marmoribigeumensis]